MQDNWNLPCTTQGYQLSLLHLSSSNPGPLASPFSGACDTSSSKCIRTRSKSQARLSQLAYTQPSREKHISSIYRISKAFRKERTLTKPFHNPTVTTYIPDPSSVPPSLQTPTQELPFTILILFRPFLHLLRLCLAANNRNPSESFPYSNPRTSLRLLDSAYSSPFQAQLAVKKKRRNEKVKVEAELEALWPVWDVEWGTGI